MAAFSISVSLFESGAIVLHIADHHPGLWPADPDGRARAVTWMFAALGTIEPPIVERETAIHAERGRPWLAEHLGLVEQRIVDRLTALSDRLGDADWLDGAFSAGDLMMVSVLRRLEGSALLDTHPRLSAYVARGKARPAFERAFAAQLAVFTSASAG